MVVGADTLVACHGQIFGKPKDAIQAREMLADLSDRMHEVWSGVALFPAVGGDAAASLHGAGPKYACAH